METRGELREAIREWSQRRSIPDNTINTFIELAMSRANRMLRIPPLESHSVIEVTTDGYLNIPSDYLETKELSLDVNGNRIILERKSINEVDYMYTRSIGSPCIFGRIGNQFRIAPWGLEDTSVGLYYYNIIPKMVDDQQTNWLLEFAPEVILYGALEELAKYTRDDEGTSRWAGQFTNAVNILQSTEDRSEWRGSSIGVSIQGSY